MEAPASASPNASPHGNVIVTVKVLSGRNIHGSKGDKPSTSVRIQFADLEGKDSAVVPETSSPEYAHSWAQTFDIDEVKSTPVDYPTSHVTFTVIESLPKEKTAVLGTGELHLFNKLFKIPNLVEQQVESDTQISKEDVEPAKVAPLEKIVPAARARTASAHPSERKGSANIPEREGVSFRETVTISNQPADAGKKLAATNSSTAGTPDDPHRSVLEVEVVLSRPLLSEEDRATGMFIMISPRQVYPTPEEWTVKEANEKDPASNIYQYTLQVTVPSTGGRDRAVRVTGGMLYEQGSSEPPPNKAESIARSRSVTVSDSTGLAAATPAPTAVPPAPHKKIVQWPKPATVWMYKEALDRLKEKVMAKEPLEVELSRDVQPRFAHAADATGSRFRARSQLDCSNLILPRLTTLCARCPLEGWVDTEAKGKKGDKGEDPYVKAGAMVSIEVVLERELIERKKLQPITQTVRDFIPPRKNLTAETYAKRAQKAEADYKAKIQEIARRLVKEWVEVVGLETLEKVKEGFVEEAEKSKKKFLYHMNASGTYFHLKESLKPAITHLVRAHLRQQHPPPTPDDLHIFLSNLYVQLVGSMHSALHAIFRDPASHAEDRKHEERQAYAAMGRFADECERDGDWAGAEKYHLERVARWEGSEEAWYEYGCFEMRRGNGEVGVECLKEVLAGLPGAREGAETGRHIPSLLAYGATLASTSDHTQARVMLETAQSLAPTYHLSATILGLYLQMMDYEEESDVWMSKGRMLWFVEGKERGEGGAKEQGHEEVVDEEGKRRSSYLDAAEFLMHCRATQMAERAIAAELLQPSVTLPTIYLLQSRLQLLRGDASDAERVLHAALDKRQDEPDVWAELGHVAYRRGWQGWDAAREKYEVVVGMGRDPEDPYLVHLRLATIYLCQSYGPLGVAVPIPDESSHPATNTTASTPPPTTSPTSALPTPTSPHLAHTSRDLFLLAVRAHPTSTAWLGVARASLAMAQWDAAEDALSEANTVEPRDGRVWVWLAVCCVVQGRAWEGKRCWKQVGRWGVGRGAGVGTGLRLLGSALFRSGDYSLAADVLRMYLDGSPSFDETGEGDTDGGARRLFERAVEEMAGKEEGGV
ncbi:Cilia- and flagella-associated protein 70 [Gonapodya sp. JEL0774]|nr:Cilia- and flagella-associated protein 70 [Gonapodya sp. JEL0774]